MFRASGKPPEVTSEILPWVSGETGKDVDGEESGIDIRGAISWKPEVNRGEPEGDM